MIIKGLWVSSDPEYNVNRKDKYRENTLSVAIETENVEAVKLLMQHPRIDPNIRYKYNQAPLHRAVNKGNIEILEEILKHPDTDPNIRDRRMVTPIHDIFQCRGFSGFVSIVKVFLRHPDIDVNAIDDCGRTPLFYATSKYDGESMKLLLKHGARIHSCVELIQKRSIPYFNGYVHLVSILENWRSYLPRWNRFMTAKRYPKEFNDKVFAWLCVCKRIKIFPKDMRYFIVGYIAEAWKIYACEKEISDEMRFYNLYMSKLE